MSKLISTNPAQNYKKVGQVEISTPSEIKAKVKAAHQAKQNWKEIGVKERAKALKRVYTNLKKAKKEIAILVSREMGMPITESLVDVDSGLEYLKSYIDNGPKHLAPEITIKKKKEVHTVYYEPVGVVAVIAPWNFPFSLFIWGVMANLISGNTVVFKISEETPLIGRFLEKIINRSRLPKGVFSEVYGAGDVGDKLVHSEVDLIWLTGSSRTGEYLYKVGAEKFIRCILELGGSAPGIVFEDADLEVAIEDVYANRFLNCGQVCDGLKRAIVHKSIVKEFVNKMAEKIGKAIVGNPERKTTQIGPLAAKRQVELIDSQVKDAVKKGAKIVVGGDRVNELKGAFYKPTLLTEVKRNMRVWQEEVFGPVLPVVTFSTEEEAVKLANDTKYGLGGYVYAKDIKKAERVASRIKTGMVGINGAMYVVPSNPFGGCKISGIGREHSKWGLRELCDIKIVAVSK